MAAEISLVCPKCGGRMQGYERTNILVEQCQVCRGIYLDHGELERLIDAEGGGWSGMIEPPTTMPEPKPSQTPRRLGRADPQRRLRDLFGDD
jgi:Zn-finger nucleic acid-binding protein